MKTIKEVYCTKCGKKQVRDVADLLKNDLFWRVCEFCGNYGLTIVTRHKATFREYMEAFYNTLGFQVVQTEAFLKDLLKDCKPL
jgi:predicted RNA methylase